MKLKATFAEYFRIIGSLLELDDETSRSVETLVSSIPDDSDNAAVAEMLQALFEQLGNQPDFEKFGFLLSDKIPLTSFGDLAVGLRISPNFIELLRYVVKFYSLEAPFVHYSLEEDSEGAIFSASWKSKLSPRAEMIFSSMVANTIDKELSRILQGHRSFRRIELTSGTNRLTEEYEARFNISPIQECPANRFYFDEWTLQLPNPESDPLTFNRIQQEFEKQAEASGAQEDIETLVKSALETKIANPPKIEELATSLNLSIRQLRYALTKSGTSYKDLLIQSRLAYAQNLLANPSLRISDIAYKLGYSDHASFNHAFKKWMGISPREYRDSLP